MPVVLTMFFLSVGSASADVKLDYIYNLSDFNGMIPFSWVNFGVDQKANELYVVDPSDQTVEVFNNAGLMVHSFGDEGEFGAIRRIAVDEDGTIYLLSSMGPRSQIYIADFRGEMKGTISFTGLPPLFTDNFAPDRIFYRDGHLYLVDTFDFKVLITDRSGNYHDGFAFDSMIGVNYKKRSDFDIRGCTVDRDGNLIFTIPVQALVYLISPDRKVTSFGRHGSSPGKFNVVAGVAADNRGYLYVTDTLRCVIMVFARDKDFSFCGEFGYRGWDPDNLIAPMEVAVLGDFVYVAQSAKRGVSVFRITIN